MRVLVTGGAGFIGSHVVDRCLQEGHEVAVIDNLRSGSRYQVDPRAEFIELDIRSIRLPEIIGHLRPEAILHFAAQIDVRVSCQDPVFDAEENILATLRLIETGLAKGLQHFVFASSGGAIYGEASGAQSEAHPEVPINPYGVAKLAVDKYLHAYKVQKGLASCSLRFSNVYGPRQGARGEAGVVAVFCKRLRDQLPLQVNGDGSQTRDFVFAPDLADAVSRVLEQRATGIFNLGTGIETSIQELATSLCHCAQADPTLIHHGAAIPGEQRRSVMDASKAIRELCWTPSTAVQAGLAQTYDWFLTHREEA
ncbi:MAG: NAD-dependent epimerase/dehydratase family protein [Holophaga sp.]|nr:NAD-dependent epimerase/dehydratase family protein [Holophaga sp.]